MTRWQSSVGRVRCPVPSYVGRRVDANVTRNGQWHGDDVVASWLLIQTIDEKVGAFRGVSTRTRSASSTGQPASSQPSSSQPANGTPCDHPIPLLLLHSSNCLQFSL